MRSKGTIKLYKKSVNDYLKFMKGVKETDLRKFSSFKNLDVERSVTLESIKQKYDKVEVLK